MSKRILSLIAVFIISGTALSSSQNTMTREESIQILGKMKEVLPAAQWVSHGTLKTLRTVYKRDADGKNSVAVDEVTIYTDGSRLLQRTKSIRKEGVESKPRVPEELKSRMKLGESSVSPTTTSMLFDDNNNRRIIYLEEPIATATIDETGRMKGGHNGILTSGVFQREGILSDTSLGVSTVSGKKTSENTAEITISRPDMTIIVTIDLKTYRPLLCNLRGFEGRSSLWEWEWPPEPCKMPLQVSISVNADNGSSEASNFRHISVSDEVSPKDFELDFKYETPVTYYPPLNSGVKGSIVYRYNPRLDLQRFISLRIQYELSQQKLKNCATASLMYVADALGVNLGDTSSLVHLNPNASKDEPKNQSDALEIRNFLREKGLYCEAIKSSFDFLRPRDNASMVLDKDTVVIIRIIERFPHFVVLVALEGKDVWVGDFDSPKCLRTLIPKAVKEWDGASILVSSKPLDKLLREGDVGTPE
jgi:hypothetical protein